MTLSSTALSPTFTTPTDLPASIVLEFTLRVTDEGGLSDEDTVRFWVSATPEVSTTAVAESTGETALGTPARSRAHDDQLLLEQKMLRDHRSHATGATQRRGHDGQVKQGEQEVLHARDSVGQTSGATQRGLNPGFSERIGNSRRTG